MENGAELNYNVEDVRLAARSAMGQPCPYCAEPVEPETFSFDHDIPVSRGGSFAFSNLVVICKRCNDVKGNMSGKEFGELLTTVHSFTDEVSRSILSRMRAGARFYN